MGNLISASFYIKSKVISSKTKKNSTAKLVDSQGNLTLIPLPTTAAELMLDNPGFAVSSVDDIHCSGRLPAIRADEGLLPRKVYLLFPVDKVNSRLSDLQLAAIDSLCFVKSKSKSKKNRRANSSQVCPVTVTGESLDGFGLDLGGERSCNLQIQRQRLGKLKPWTPALQPILEE